MKLHLKRKYYKIQYICTSRYLWKNEIEFLSRFSPRSKVICIYCACQENIGWKNGQNILYLIQSSVIHWKLSCLFFNSNNAELTLSQMAMCLPTAHSHLQVSTILLPVFFCMNIYCYRKTELSMEAAHCLKIIKI